MTPMSTFILCLRCKVNSAHESSQSEAIEGKTGKGIKAKLRVGGREEDLSIVGYAKQRDCSAHCTLRDIDTLVRSVAVTDIWTTLHS